MKNSTVNKTILFRNHVEILPTLKIDMDNKVPTRGFGRDEMELDFRNNGDFDRLQTDLIDKEIERIWDERTRTNKRLYNKSKFRLYGHEFVSSERFNIKVGLTCYKDLIGTHYASNASDLLNQSRRQNNGDRSRYMSNGIGVGAWAETSDRHVVLQRRSDWLGEGAGMIDRPGGHPEPDLVKDQLNDPKSVLREIFDSPKNELRDETNISFDYQSDSELIGIIWDMSLGGRVGLDFKIMIELTKQEVINRYNQGGHSEADESTELVFISKSDLKNWNFDENFLKQMTGHCIGGLRLYHIYLNN